MHLNTYSRLETFSFYLELVYQKLQASNGPVERWHLDLKQIIETEGVKYLCLSVSVCKDIIFHTWLFSYMVIWLISSVFLVFFYDHWLKMTKNLQ